MGNKQSNKIPGTADPGSRARRRTDPGRRRRAATMAAIRRADGRVDYNTRDVEGIYPNWYVRRGTVPGIYFSADENLNKAFENAREAAREAKAAREAANNLLSPATPETPYPGPALARTIRRLNAEEVTRRNSAILREVPSPVNYSKRDVESLYNWYAPDAQNLDKAFQDAIEEANNESYDSYSSNDVTMEDSSNFARQREANARAVARMEAAMAAMAAARAARVTDLPDWDRRVIPLEKALADAERALDDAERALDDSDVVVRLFGAGINEDLIQAAGDGNYKDVKRLLEAGANMEATDNYGGTALLGAALAGNENIVKLLLEAGANMEATNAYGYTALIGAADNGQTDTVKLLIDAGANTEATDKYGKTALMMVLNEGYDDDRFGIARLFIDKDALGSEAEAARAEATLVELLRRAGAKRGDPWQNRPNKRPMDSNWVVSEPKRPRDPTWDVSESASYLGNRLVKAVIDDQAELVRHLLATSGIDVNTVNDRGYTALMVAAESGDTEVVRQLLAAPSIDVNTVNDSGDTALMFAASEGHAEVVKMLLDAPGIDMYLKNDRGDSAWLQIDFSRKDIHLLFKQKVDAEEKAYNESSMDVTE